MGQPINLSTVSPIPIFNQMWPADCPKSLALRLNMNVGAGGADVWDLNTLLLNQTGFIEGIQACYYDNSQNNSDIVFECPDTGFRTTFYALRQGFRALLVARDQLTGVFSTTGGTGFFNINMTNTPIQPLEIIP